MDRLALLARAQKAFLRFPAGRSRDLAADFIDYLTGELSAELGDRAGVACWRSSCSLTFPVVAGEPA